MAAPGAVLNSGHVNVAMLGCPGPPTAAAATIDPAAQVDHEGATDGERQQKDRIKPAHAHEQLEQPLD